MQILHTLHFKTNGKSLHIDMHSIKATWSHYHNENFSS